MYVTDRNTRDSPYKDDQDEDSKLSRSSHVHLAVRPQKPEAWNFKCILMYSSKSFFISTHCLVIKKF